MSSAPSRAAKLWAARQWAAAGCLLVLTVLVTQPAGAQNLNDLLGGNDSALIPAKQVEPKLTVTLTPDGPLEKGSTLTLAIKAEYGPDAYTYSQNPSFGGATKITVGELFGLEAIDDKFTPDRKPKVAFEELVGQDLEKFHGGVTWTRSYRYVGDIPAEQIFLSGSISYQVCDKQNCRPLRKEFEAFPPLPKDAAASSTEIADAAPMTNSPSTGDSSIADSGAGPETRSLMLPDISALDRPSAAAGGELEMRAAQTPEDMKDVPLVFNLGSRADEGSLPWYLTMAFLGGLILNVMPCVLPVLAIKVMSFVQQAGESRGRVLALNLSYSTGVIAVFLILASLAVTLQMGWGGLFQRPEFSLVMIAVVFAMGLSLLGVFEIPIPGMIGSAGGQHREGLLGAFLIGIFATLLATPCSGPLMGPVLAWSVKQEPSIVYLVWGMMGLGMASPFLIVGTIPTLARFIPRPGDWMVRFKEFSGFALLAAAIWLMLPLPSEVILPTLIMLFGLGLALWMVGSLYNHTSSTTRKMSVRFYALLTIGVIGWYGASKYTEGEALADARRAGTSTSTIEQSLREDENNRAIVHADGELPWEPFSEERLLSLLKAGRPVLVDFTADWCLVCKQNEKFALNTAATSKFVREHDVVTLYADFTREDPVIKKWLNQLGSIAVPLTVVFPAGNPQEPLIQDGPFTQSTLLSMLKQAVLANVAAKERQSALLDTTTR